MAKKLQLGYKQIEANLKIFRNENIPAEEVGYALLMAFGKSEREIARYKEGKGVVKSFAGLLVKGLLCYKPADTMHLTEVLEELKIKLSAQKSAPKLIAVSDGITLLAYDTQERDTYENKLTDVYCDFLFLYYPLTGSRRVHNEAESPADVKAAEKLAKLHDEIRAYNEYSSDADLHDLNTFISRLLFCFFAEDTGIFTANLFTNFIKTCTRDDGSDLSEMIGDAFRIMDKRPQERPMDLSKEINAFPYVNGGLFARDIPIPTMGRKARKIIIDCGELDWQGINPDIFGSMIQAVVNPAERAKEGMHYTSVPNILKVINPLFMDDLRQEYNRLNDLYRQKKNMLDMSVTTENQFYDEGKRIIHSCEKLLLRMSKMKFMDPACGSGNFLVITYKQLRLLEMDILRLSQQCTKEQRIDFIDGSHIKLNQFYGIEILDFPHEIAMLSLWLAEHQMNNKFHADFGVNIAALPLHNISQIVKKNACRVDWNEVCPHAKDEEVYVFGNPPYLGSKLQTQEQKKDIAYVFGKLKNSKILDYISIWFYLGAKFIRNTKARMAYVSTNSICQGEQVSVLWPSIYEMHEEISFAYTSFKWSNNAKHNAGVTVVIVGISNQSNEVKLLYDADKVSRVSLINPYLSTGTKTIVYKSVRTPQDYPKLCFGSMPYDDGNLLMNNVEYEDFVRRYPAYSRYIKMLYGSEEFINDKPRYCLWIDDEDADDALKNEEIKRRVDRTRAKRLDSTDPACLKLAEKPYQFREHPSLTHEKIIIPRVSSERREYIPMGYLGKDTVISDSAFAIYDAPLSLFGILTSRIHMTWVCAVGGRLKTDYRYSAGLCYNTFPFPSLSASKKQEIEEAAENVLLTRENYPDKSLAELYDTEKMPEDLRKAHETLDRAVESCYPDAPFDNDEERLECLFRLYERYR